MEHEEDGHSDRFDEIQREAREASKRLREEDRSPEEEKEPDEGMLVNESMSSDENEALEKTLKGIYDLCDGEPIRGTGVDAAYYDQQNSRQAKGGNVGSCRKAGCPTFHFLWWRGVEVASPRPSLNKLEAPPGPSGWSAPRREGPEAGEGTCERGPGWDSSQSRSQ